jgi:hypothetical protein
MGAQYGATLRDALSCFLARSLLTFSEGDRKSSSHMEKMRVKSSTTHKKKMQTAN